MVRVKCSPTGMNDELAHGAYEGSCGGGVYTTAQGQEEARHAATTEVVPQPASRAQAAHSTRGKQKWLVSEVWRSYSVLFPLETDVTDLISSSGM